jgi:hypothetical protein
LILPSLYFKIGQSPVTRRQTNNQELDPPLRGGLERVGDILNHRSATGDRSGASELD